jgi:hypothetical protein
LPSARVYPLFTSYLALHDSFCAPPARTGTLSHFIYNPLGLAPTSSSYSGFALPPQSPHLASGLPFLFSRLAPQTTRCAQTFKKTQASARSRRSSQCLLFSFGVTSAQSVLLLVLSADYPWAQSWESLVVCLLWDLTCNSGCFNLFTSLGFTQPLTHRQCKLVTTLEGSHLLFKMLSLVPFDIN